MRNGASDSVGLATAWSGVPKEEVLAQLASILDSPQFRASKRCSQFLRYVVEHACEGQVERLKERVLGVEVFDRDPHYDTNQDPVVRITAGEVRKRLAQYYQQPGREVEIRIGLPPGSYVPEAHRTVDKPEAVEVAAPARRRWALVGVCCGVAAALALGAAALRPQPSGLDLFWSPVIAPDRNVLVCIGQPKAYHFTSGPQRQLDTWFENGREQQGPAPIPGVALADVVPAWDWYVSVEDAQTFARLSALFAQQGARAHLQGARSVSLTDLRGKPVVLIGAFNNDWTLGLAGELRFFFDVQPNGTGTAQVVRDRLAPEKITEWRVSNSWPRKRVDEDYAIITRVQNKTTEQTVVIAAGITRYGTQGAGEFLTNESYFAEAIAGAPSDWQHRNMQVVISVKVMSGTPGPPKVAAVHFW